MKIAVVNDIHVGKALESTIEKSFFRAFNELQRLQAMRLGHPVTLPIAIDADMSEQENGFAL